jgi:squalene-associated FAD-dependent desaturase
MGAEHLTTMQDRLDVPVVVAGVYGGGHLTRTSLRRSTSALPPPLHLTTGLLAYRALPLIQRLRAGLMSLELGALDSDDPAVDATTFGSWLADHGASAESIAGLWDLLTVATLNTSVADASLALAATVVRTGLLETSDGGDIGWARVPLGQIHDTAARAALQAAGVDVRTGVTVRSVGPGVAGTWAVGSDTEDVVAEAVVLAVPPHTLADLAPAGVLPDPGPMRDLTMSPIVNIHLVYDRHVLDAPFVAAVGSPVQWVFDRTASSGLAAAASALATDGQCLAISISDAGDWIDKPAADVATVFESEMARLFPAARQARVIDSVVTRERQATPRQVAGSGAARPAQRTTLPGLALAGAWTATGWPATMESAARSGVAAAGYALGSAVPRKRAQPVREAVPA